MRVIITNLFILRNMIYVSPRTGYQKNKINHQQIWTYFGMCLDVFLHEKPVTARGWAMYTKEKLTSSFFGLTLSMRNKGNCTEKISYLVMNNWGQRHRNEVCENQIYGYLFFLFQALLSKFVHTFFVFIPDLHKSVILQIRIY